MGMKVRVAILAQRVTGSGPPPPKFGILAVNSNSRKCLT